VAAVVPKISGDPYKFSPLNFFLIRPGKSDPCPKVLSALPSTRGERETIVRDTLVRDAKELTFQNSHSQANLYTYNIQRGREGEGGREGERERERERERYIYNIQKSHSQANM
jgi:hypothetical protein